MNDVSDQKTARPKLKAIFFDAVGTLIYLPKSVGEHYREVALRHGAALQAEALEREFRRCWKSAPARLRLDGPRTEDDKGWWRTLVRKVIESTLPPESTSVFNHEAYFEELYAHFALPGVWLAYPEVESMLRSFQSQGLALGMISNFDRRLYQVLDHLQLTQYFSGIVVSSEVGTDKPDPAIFQHALSLFDVQPDEAVHVGDDPKRDRGALAVGVDVFELDRPVRSLEGLPAWLHGRTAS